MRGTVESSAILTSITHAEPLVAPPVAILSEPQSCLSGSGPIISGFGIPFLHPPDPGGVCSTSSGNRDRSSGLILLLDCSLLGPGPETALF
jgi:hypothetical protein